jgi:hypothetical protein
MAAVVVVVEEEGGEEQAAVMGVCKSIGKQGGQTRARRKAMERRRVCV